MKRFEEILERIKTNTGTFPKDEIEILQEKREETLPKLLSLMEDVRDNYQTYIHEESMLQLYATFLLAEFRCKEFFPIFIDIAMLPGELNFDLFGDTVTEAFQRIMASVYNGDLELLHSLIEDTSVNIFVRKKGIDALTILVLEGVLERKSVVEYFKSLLLEGGREDDSFYISGLISALTDLYPEDSMEEIQWTIDTFSMDIDMDYVLQQLERGEEEAIEDLKKRHHYQRIGSTVEEMKMWACFHRDRDRKKRNRVKMRKKTAIPYPIFNKVTIKKERKIGRNEPCPCGNGKKFKKCCG